MEKMGIPHAFKSSFLSVIPTLSSFHRVILQAISQTTDIVQRLGLLRVLLLSSYLLHRLGFRCSLSLVDMIDCSLAFASLRRIRHSVVWKEIENPSALSDEHITSLLRFLQTLLLCLTRNGELLLNCDLFPALVVFLQSDRVKRVIEEGDVKVLSWYTVTCTYLSYNRGNDDTLRVAHTEPLLAALSQWDAPTIPIGCNCVRALFPRE